MLEFLLFISNIPRAQTTIEAAFLLDSSSAVSEKACFPHTLRLFFKKTSEILQQWLWTISDFSHNGPVVTFRIILSSLTNSESASMLKGKLTQGNPRDQLHDTYFVFVWQGSFCFCFHFILEEAKSVLSRCFMDLAVLAQKLRQRTQMWLML